MLAVVYSKELTDIIILCLSKLKYSESYSLFASWRSEVSKVHCHNSKIPWFYCKLSYSPAGLTSLQFILVLFTWLCLCFWSGPFLQGFCTRILYTVLPCILLCSQPNKTSLVLYSKLTFYECTNFKRKQSYYIWPALTLVWISVPIYKFLSRHLRISNNYVYEHIASAVVAEIHSVQLPRLSGIWEENVNITFGGGF
jgi:hypothetical protein